MAESEDEANAGSAEGVTGTRPAGELDRRGRRRTVPPAATVEGASISASGGMIDGATSRASWSRFLVLDAMVLRKLQSLGPEAASIFLQSTGEP